MAKKIDSLWKLRVLGLNTSNFKILKSRLDVDYFFNRTDWKRISIRTDLKDPTKRGVSRFGLPFFPNLDYLEARKIIVHDSTVSTDDLDIIVSEGIDPKDALLSGKIIMENELKGNLEYILGASTVRSLDYVIPKRYTVKFSEPVTLLSFNLPLEKLSHQIKQIILPSFRTPFIIEFSIYSHPIGRLKDRLIYWEVTPNPR